MRQMVKPRWGLLEIVAVYIGIITAGLLFGRYAGMVKTWLEGTGIEDKTLAFFTIGYMYQFIITILLVLLFTLVLNRARLSDLEIGRAHV